MKQPLSDKHPVRVAADDPLNGASGVLGAFRGAPSGTMVEGDYECLSIASTEETSQADPVPIHLVVFFL